LTLPRLPAIHIEDGSRSAQFATMASLK
jgi:hypothetical protein